MTIGRGQEMTLTLNTQINLMNSISCLYLLTFRSEATKFSGKSIVFENII